MRGAVGGGRRAAYRGRCASTSRGAVLILQKMSIEWTERDPCCTIEQGAERGGSGPSFESFVTGQNPHRSSSIRRVFQ